MHNLTIINYIYLIRMVTINSMRRGINPFQVQPQTYCDGRLTCPLGQIGVECGTPRERCVKRTDQDSEQPNFNVDNDLDGGKNQKNLAKNVDLIQYFLSECFTMFKHCMNVIEKYNEILFFSAVYMAEEFMFWFKLFLYCNIFLNNPFCIFQEKNHLILIQT